MIGAVSKSLPPDSMLAVHPERQGPVRAEEFESWQQDPQQPMELVAGWVVPMSPGTFRTGILAGTLFRFLAPEVASRGWLLSLDARHRLPLPQQTVVFPDLAVHCTAEVEYVADTETVARVPDIVIELLSPETAEKDRAPLGAKFLAYQMSGVREYYYAWPDGREATGFALRDGICVPVPVDADGWLQSGILRCGLRFTLEAGALVRPL